jgi:hypothetical protein
MIELEERLRSGLANLAGEVPPSRDPLVEQRRRQARAVRPSGRRPLLTAAAVAAVLAIGAIPAAVTHNTQPAGEAQGGQNQGGQPVSVTQGQHADPSPDGPYLTITNGPFQVATFTENGQEWSVLVFVERLPAGSGWAHRACAVGVRPGAAPNDPNWYPGSTGCIRPSDKWPTVRSSPLVVNRNPDGGPFPGKMLVVAPGQVARLDVHQDQKPPQVIELARTNDLVMYVVDLFGIGRPFHYTAWDARGAVLEEA